MEWANIVDRIVSANSQRRNVVVGGWVAYRPTLSQQPGIATAWDLEAWPSMQFEGFSGVGVLDVHDGGLGGFPAGGDPLHGFRNVEE
ncbi:hypothetical protein [Rhodococcus koreensis]|uniref:hypothetical protein n=1 Tax=Rhodococcus koreensis TaxID=99653 RepID=UPI00198005C3|nr:hypothetical protein [Rhodococcus koreensis]QSE86910.1 hypothetical protein JWS14_48715 [Rhodococcus koreensis]